MMMRASEPPTKQRRFNNCAILKLPIASDPLVAAGKFAASGKMSETIVLAGGEATTVRTRADQQQIVTGAKLIAV